MMPHALKVMPRDKHRPLKNQIKKAFFSKNKKKYRENKNKRKRKLE
jgi:hypothetical protein